MEDAEDDLELLQHFMVSNANSECMVYVYESHVDMYSVQLNRIGDDLKVLLLDLSESISWRHTGFRWRDEEYTGNVNDINRFRLYMHCKVVFLNISSDYAIGEIIGSGSFADVYRIECLGCGHEYALKCLKVKDQMSMQNEATILSSVMHPSVIRIYDVYERNNQYCLVLELVEGQSLSWIQKNKKSRILEKDAQMIIQETLSALQYLHSRGVIHRDIKPGNIMLTRKNIKIIDFGLSTNSTPRNQCGTPGYIAPEIFQNEPWTDLCDVFSLGAVFFKLLNQGVPCFQSQTTAHIMLKNKRGIIDFTHIRGYSESALSLLKAMCAPTNERISSAEALKHQFFQADCQECKGQIQVYQKKARPSVLSRNLCL